MNTLCIRRKTPDGLFRPTTAAVADYFGVGWKSRRRLPPLTKAAPPRAPGIRRKTPDGLFRPTTATVTDQFDVGWKSRRRLPPHTMAAPISTLCIRRKTPGGLFPPYHCNCHRLIWCRVEKPKAPSTTYRGSADEHAVHTAEDARWAFPPYHCNCRRLIWCRVEKPKAPSTTYRSRADKTRCAYGGRRPMGFAAGRNRNNTRQDASP